MNRKHVISFGVVSVLLVAAAIAAALPSVRWSDAEIQHRGHTGRAGSSSSAFWWYWQRSAAGTC